MSQSSYLICMIVTLTAGWFLGCGGMFSFIAAVLGL